VPLGDDWDKPDAEIDARQEDKQDDGQFTVIMRPGQPVQILTPDGVDLQKDGVHEVFWRAAGDGSNQLTVVLEDPTVELHVPANRVLVGDMRCICGINWWTGSSIATWKEGEDAGALHLAILQFGRHHADYCPRWVEPDVDETETESDGV